jgi:hypothetical protein
VTNLVTLQLDQAVPCDPTAYATVTVSANIYRGGVLGSGDSFETNLPQQLDVLVCECFPNTAAYSTQYATWVAMGRPGCWCSSAYFGNSGRQCHGDANNDKQTLAGYRVYSNDFNAVVLSWKAKMTDAHLNPCADIDHKSQTLASYRVYSNDSNRIVNNWKDKDTALPADCPLTDAANNAYVDPTP